MVTYVNPYNADGTAQPTTPRPAQTPPIRSGGLPSFPSLPSFGNTFQPVVNGINQFGFNNLGLGTQVPLPYTGSTPFGTTVIGGAGNPTLTGLGGGILGGAGAGGFAAGLTGGNTTAGSIAGGLGGGIAAWAGLSSFSTMGIGAVAGLAAGKLFKKKPSDKTMAGGINLETGEVNRYYADQESSTGKKFDDNNAKMRDAVEQGAARFTKFLKDNGAKLKDNNADRQDEMVFVIGGRDGYRLFEYERGANTRDDGPRIQVHQHKGYQNFGTDYESYSKGITSRLLDRYELSDDLRKQIESMDIKDIASFGQAQPGQSSITYSGPPRRDQMLPPRGVDKPNPSFEQFLKDYRSKYNANAVPA